MIEACSEGGRPAALKPRSAGWGTDTAVLLKVAAGLVADRATAGDDPSAEGRG